MRTILCTLAAMEQLDSCRCISSCQWLFVSIRCWSRSLLSPTARSSVKIGLKLALDFCILWLNRVSCFAMRCFLSMTPFVGILILCWLWRCSADLFWTRILNHVNLTVRIGLVGSLCVILFHFRNLMLDIVECKHITACLVLGCRWMSEALTGLGLRLYIHHLFLIDERILVWVRYI